MNCPHCKGTGKVPRPVEPELKGIPKPAMDILKAVAAEYSTTPLDILKSYGKESPHLKAKFIAVRQLRARRYPHGRAIYSYEQIGSWFNNHHTSIMHLCKLPGDEK